MATTANVTTTVTGTGWTVNVGPCNLDLDVNIKDFAVIRTDINSIINNTQFDKLSPVQIQYTGPALPANTPITVIRKTPLDQRVIAGYQSQFSSNDYNQEFQRIVRRAYEYELNGVGPGSLLTFPPTLLNAAYNFSTWNADSTNGATRQALSNKFNSIDSTNNSQTTSINTLNSQMATANTNIANLQGINAGTRLTNLEANTGLLFAIWNGVTYPTSDSTPQAANNSIAPVAMTANIPGWTTAAFGNSTTITFPVSGIYTMTWITTVSHTGSPTPTSYAATVTRNGTPQVNLQVDRPWANSVQWTQYLVAGDVITIRAIVTGSNSGTLTYNFTFNARRINN